MRESLVEAQAAAGGSIAHDVSVTVSSIPEIIERVYAAVAAACTDIRRYAFGHVGIVNMHANRVKRLNLDRAAFRAATACKTMKNVDSQQHEHLKTHEYDP